MVLASISTTCRVVYVKRSIDCSNYGKYYNVIILLVLTLNSHMHTLLYHADFSGAKLAAVKAAFSEAEFDCWETMIGSRGVSQHCL